MTSTASRLIGRQIQLRSQVARILGSDKFKLLIAANFIAVMIIVVRAIGWLQPFELSVYDALRVAWAGNLPSDRIIVVGATEDDIARWHWPLRDGELAELLERLASWKPRAIGVDLYRDRPQPPGSEELAAVLARHPEIIWVFKLGGDGDREVLAPESLRDTDRAVLADVLVDPGGVVRRGLLYADDGVENHVAFGVALALLYLRPQGIRLQPESSDRLRLGKSVISLLDSSQGPYVRLDDRGYQILLDYRGGPNPFRRVSVADVMDRDAVRSLVHDRVVIIGSAAESVRDLFTTPFSNELTGFGNVPPITGMEIHGHLADQLIRGALNGEPSLGALTHRTEIMWIWAWGMAGTLMAMAVRRTVPGLGATLAGLGALGVIVYEAFGMAFLLPALPAGLAWVGAAGMSNRILYVEQRWRERRRVGVGKDRWMPPPADMPEGAIFISYAREDLGAVRTLKNSLEAAGLMVWFDFDRIAAGDSFDHKIHDNIERCSLFLPVLSHNTEARSEGFFRREWRYALDRDMGIAPDVPFIIPVAVENMDRFNTLPPRFRELHITALPEGQVTQEFVDRLQQIQTKGPSQAA